MEELKTLSKPLIETCESQVAEQIENLVQETLTAWNETFDNLNALCSKYQRAVQLWERYREASAAVKNWSDQQMETIDELKQPLEALKDIQVSDSTKTEGDRVRWEWRCQVELGNYVKTCLLIQKNILFIVTSDARSNFSYSQ